MDVGSAANRKESSCLTMPIPMNYGSIHESSKFGSMLATHGSSIRISGSSSSLNGPLPVLHSSAGVPPQFRPPAPQPPSLVPRAPPTTEAQVEESSAGGHGAAATSEMGSHVANSKKPVKYRECLKNHAANIGGHALDGCGEFMPSKEEASSLEALKCAACGCHRNFHRREAMEGEVLGCGFCTYSPRAHQLKDHQRPFTSLAALQPGHHPPLALPPPPSSAAGPALYLAPALHMAQQALGHSPTDRSGDHSPVDPHVSTHGQLHHTMNNTTSHAMLSMQQGHHHHHNHFGSSSNSLRKRFRTKFSSAQKDRMFDFAEKLGWRIQKHDEAAVYQFCADVGVKRHVFKVWMHNNKSTFAKKISPSEGGEAYVDNGGSSPTASSGMQP